MDKNSHAPKLQTIEPLNLGNRKSHNRNDMVVIAQDTESIVICVKATADFVE